MTDPSMQSGAGAWGRLLEGWRLSSAGRAVGCNGGQLGFGVQSSRGLLIRSSVQGHVLLPVGAHSPRQALVCLVPAVDLIWSSIQGHALLPGNVNSHCQAMAAMLCLMAATYLFWNTTQEQVLPPAGAQCQPGRRGSLWPGWGMSSQADELSPAPRFHNTPWG